MKTNFLVYITAIMASANVLAAPSALEPMTRDVAEVAGDVSILVDNCFRKQKSLSPILHHQSFTPKNYFQE